MPKACTCCFLGRKSKRDHGKGGSGLVLGGVELLPKCSRTLVSCAARDRCPVLPAAAFLCFLWGHAVLEAFPCGI